MQNEKVNQGAEVAQEAPKTNRRGLGSARGTQRMKFSHEHALANGLFMAHLDSVTVSSILIGEDKTGLPSFNGMQIPRIAFTFASNEAEPNKRRYVTLSFTAVESNVDTIPGGSKEWTVNVVFDWFKHILDVFHLKGRELTQEEEDALSLPFTDFDENGDYQAVDVEEVVAGWRTLFENFANMLNTGKNGAPMYKTVDGKNISLWIKLIRYNKTVKNGWKPVVASGDLTFPTFVGEGCIEIFNQQSKPAIRLDAVKEAIKPMNIEANKPKAPNMPAMPGINGGIPVGDPMDGGFDAGLSAEAATDMPF